MRTARRDVTRLRRENARERGMSRKQADMAVLYCAALRLSQSDVSPLWPSSNRSLPRLPRPSAPSSAPALVRVRGAVEVAVDLLLLD